MARELEIKVTVESTQAEASLGKLEDALKDVGTAAQKTADATKVYESAAGTAGRSATGLTDANAALTNQIMKYVSYAAIGAAIDRSIEFGSAVNDLSIRTGVGTDALQSLGFVASQTGSSMEMMARAVTFLDKTLESGGRKAVMAIDALGLSTSNLLQLSPEDRFRAVASAIGQMGNDAEQAQAATALFGRAGAELIPMFEELARGAEDTSLVMSQEVIGSLDEAGDAMNYATAAGRSFLGVVVAVGVETVKMLVEPFTLARQVTQGLGDDLAELAQELPKVGDITAALMPATLPDLTVDNFAKVSAGLDKQRQESEKAAKAAERLAEAQRKAYESSLVWGDGIDAAINYVARLTSEIDALHTRSGRKLSDILDFEALPYDKAVEDLTRFQGSIKSFSAESSKLWVPFVASATKAVTDVAASFGNLRGAFSNLGQTIVGAIQGGGNVFGSIGASLLGGLGKDLGQKMGNAIGGTLGSTLGSFGGPLGSIAGSLAGDLAGKLFGKLFGPSQQAQVSQMRDKFFESVGGLDALRDRAQLAGVSMDALFNVKNPKDFEFAMKAFNKELAAAEKHAAEVKKYFEGLNTEMGTLLREAGNLGIVLPDALSDSITALMDSGKITGDTAELFKALGQGSESQFKAMEDAAKKYGVELSALGPAFQQNKLDKTASDIIDSFNLMTKGGADVGAVIKGMSDEINKFVQEAVKSGRTVPENMRPILDKMLEQGELTDENGQKLKDLSSIKFGAPIETAIDGLIKKIEELIDKFSKGMPSAFTDAAKAGEDFATRVGTAIEGVPRRIEFSDDTPGFDRGGIVGRHYRPPTSRDVIPALLRPGEVVLTPQQAASGLSGGGSTSVAVTINVAGYLDSSTARASLADVVKTELSKQLRREGRAA